MSLEELQRLWREYEEARERELHVAEELRVAREVARDAARRWLRAGPVERG